MTCSSFRADPTTTSTWPTRGRASLPGRFQAAARCAAASLGRWPPGPGCQAYTEATVDWTARALAQIADWEAGEDWADWRGECGLPPHLVVTDQYLITWESVAEPHRRGRWPSRTRRGWCRGMAVENRVPSDRRQSTTFIRYTHRIPTPHHPAVPTRHEKPVLRASTG